MITRLIFDNIFKESGVWLFRAFLLFKCSLFIFFVYKKYFNVYPKVTKINKYIDLQ